MASEGQPALAPELSTASVVSLVFNGGEEEAERSGSKPAAAAQPAAARKAVDAEVVQQAGRPAQQELFHVKVSGMGLGTPRGAVATAGRSPTVAAEHSVEALTGAWLGGGCVVGCLTHRLNIGAMQLVAPLVSTSQPSLHNNRKPTTSMLGALLNVLQY